MFSRSLFLFLILSLAARLGFAEPLLAIRFEGLDKTTDAFARRFVFSEVGEETNQALLEEDVQRLRNTRLFSDVNLRKEPLPGGQVAVFKAREVHTLIPVVRLGLATDSRFLQLGFTENHLLGRGITVGGYYQYYDRHSVALNFRDPFLFSDRLGLGLEAARMGTLEPLDSQAFGEAVAYAVDRTILIVNVTYQPMLGNQMDLGVGWMAETYRRESGLASAPEFLSFDKPTVKLRFARDRRDFVGSRVGGYYIGVAPEVIYSLPETTWFWKTEFEGKAYLLVGGRGNAGARVRAGFGTNESSPYPAFFVDSQLNARGAGNRVRRGTAELTMNLSYDHVVGEASWVICQVGGFADFSSVRAPAGDLGSLFTEENTYFFGGPGLRLQFPDFFQAHLRLDLGINLRRPSEFGLVLGTGRFF